MKGWKTITFNVVTGLMALSSQFADASIVSPEVLLYINIIGNFVLRFLTTTPVGKSIPGEGTKG